MEKMKKKKLEWFKCSSYNHNTNKKQQQEKWQSELVLYVDRMKINIYIGSQHLGKFGQTNVKMNERRNKKKLYATVRLNSVRSVYNNNEQCVYNNCAFARCALSISLIFVVLHVFPSIFRIEVLQ